MLIILGSQRVCRKPAKRQMYKEFMSQSTKLTENNLRKYKITNVRGDRTDYSMSTRITLNKNIK